METSRDQDGNCRKEGKTSKHLFLRQLQNESQIPECRNATFTAHKQRCLVYLVFPSLRLLSMAPVQEEEEEEEFWSYTNNTFQEGCRWSRERQARSPARGTVSLGHISPGIFLASAADGDCYWPARLSGENSK